MLEPDGTFRPLGFYSAHLNPTQKKYSVFKKELLGAFKSLRHFLPEIYGTHCTIYTDHLPLQKAFESNSIPLNDPQVYRQITEIGRFTKDIRHVSGVNNVFADWLSRIPEDRLGGVHRDIEDEDDKPLEIAAAETIKLQIASLPALAELQKKCQEIERIKKGDQPRATKFELVKIDNLDIFCEVTSGIRPYVP